MKWIVIRLHAVVQWAISRYFQWVLGWETRPVVIPEESYQQLTKAAAHSILLAMQLSSLRGRLAEYEQYDEETGDYYQIGGESEFVELGEDGKWPEEPAATSNMSRKNKKEDLN